MQQSTVTVIVASVGIVGTVAGIVIGHMLTRSWQREQWLRDCRKEEFKEVASAITQIVIEHMYLAASQGSILPQSQQAYIDSMKATYCVLIDRIYIAADLERAGIPSRFLVIMGELREGGSEFDKPADKANALLSEVIALANKY